MKRYSLVCTINFVLIFCCLSLNGFSQINSGNNAGSSVQDFSLNISGSIDNAYYFDPSGYNIAINGNSIEYSIDKATYILGPNDLLTFEIKSTQTLTFRGVIINANGEISIPSIGIIDVNGLTVTEAEHEFRILLGESFIDPEVSITLEIPRPLSVHVSGPIPLPGKYVLPPATRVDFAIYRAMVKQENLPELNSLVNIPIYTSEVLNLKDYSLRNIEINRTDGIVESADLISYFRTGNLQSNPILRNGDQINIKRITENSPTISISGAVKNSSSFEFKSGETILDVLDLVGGFNEQADTNFVYIFANDGFDNKRSRINKSEWSTTYLNPNDRVLVAEADQIKYNSIIDVEGEVNLPGKYPIYSGSTTLNEIIELSGGLTEYALPKAAYLIRAGNIENEIPNKFNADLIARTSDQYTQGIQYLNQEIGLSRNRVFIDLTNPSDLNNVTLFEGDRLFIPRDENTVFIFGQVNNPGYFPFNRNNIQSIESYIQRAGGFSLSADEDRVFIIKAGISTWFRPEDTTLESGDRIFVDRIPTENMNSLRSYEIQKQQLKNQRIQLVMTGLTTVTGIITTLVALDIINPN